VSPRNEMPRPRDRRVLAALLAASLVSIGCASAAYVADTPRLWLTNLAWTVAAGIAVTGVAAATRRSEPSARPGWRLLLAGCVAWLAGQVIWDVYNTAAPASPNPADFCWLAFAALGAVGVHRLGKISERERATSWLEVVPLIVAVCTLLTALLWRQIAASDLSAAGQVTALAYPAAYVSAALVMIQAVVAGTVDLRRNLGLGAVLAGLVVEALAFILWSPSLLGATYAIGTNAVDVLWSLGLSLVGLGAWYAGPVSAAADPGEHGRDRGGVLPGLTFGTLAITQAALILSGAPAGAVLALTAGLMIVGGTLIARASVLRSAQAALYRRVRRRERELQVLNERLGQESRRDPLTGLGNRLALSEDMLELDARAQRYDHGYSLVLCDLDLFKAYNDRMGHQAGDDVLRQVARLLEHNTRAGDRIYRYGGEELLLVLPEQDEQAGRVAAEHHRAALEHAALPHPMNTPDVVTFSAGVAAAARFESPEDVLRRADQALYEAKAGGRNRVCLAAAVAL
jgi:diguanylate cyclase (GGDEF)-like protein